MWSCHPISNLTPEAMRTARGYVEQVVQQLISARF